MTHRQRRFHAPADLFLLAGPGGVEADEDVVLGLGVGHDVHRQDLVPVQYSTEQYIQYRTSYPACLKVDTTTTPSPPRPPYTITLPGMLSLDTGMGLISASLHCLSTTGHNIRTCKLRHNTPALPRALADTRHQISGHWWHDFEGKETGSAPSCLNIYISTYLLSISLL